MPIFNELINLMAVCVWFVYSAPHGETVVRQSQCIAKDESAFGFAKFFVELFLIFDYSMCCFGV
jgi:hypothetical protein